MRYEDNILWMSQKMICLLFDVSKATLSEHFKNIFDNMELDELATVRNFRTIKLEGNREVTRNIKHYNLEAIISVGYRVNSKRAIEFRRWATNILKNYATKGYVIDRTRMENGSFLNEDYFEELLEEIREIRLSERRFYQKLTDIYATSTNYDRTSLFTKEFFAKVQNKMHYAVSGATAPEIIYNRVNSNVDYMGLTSWKNSPDGKILRSDVKIAKNYLTKDEIDDLGRIVGAFLDLAESRAKRRILMTMEDWASQIDKFLFADDRDILKDAGKISMDV